MNSSNSEIIVQAGTQTPPTNVVSLGDWKAGKRPEIVTPPAMIEEKIVGAKTRKLKTPVAKTKDIVISATADNVARSIRAQSYLIEMYTDMLTLAVTALSEIERTASTPKTAKVASDTLATIRKIVNQVTTDLQDQLSENSDKNDT